MNGAGRNIEHNALGGFIVSLSLSFLVCINQFSQSKMPSYVSFSPLPSFCPNINSGFLLPHMISSRF
ncbi:hypothetical protein L2E82_27951 [Cichorium intybus]|uniref:Uncharacterized protein n=1 Tax=Cichorium intybus TaxID=13427 RepID=A0ACB9CUF1_CICIN|nr:hypothetical protein L2E82_27951 [Cichorium intybus]